MPKFSSHHANFKPRGPATWMLFFLAASTIIVSGSESVVASHGAESIFRWRPFLAPFHAVVLHLPIGFITAALLLEVYRCVRPSEEVRRITAGALWLSLITGILTAGFGWLRGAGGDYEPHLLDLHKLCGLAVPVAIAATLAWQWFAFRAGAARRLATNLYRATLFATVSLVGITGHFGGNLTHGSKYLVENAPRFIRDFMEESPAGTGSDSSGVGNENERFYRAKVQPLLEARCYPCHGAEKQKGGYRVDQREPAFKGGESEHVAIKPGDPVASRLVQLILLPAGHDDIMPPEGKQTLQPDEIMILIQWIRDGAAWPN